MPIQDSKFFGYGNPCVITVDSSATVGSDSFKARLISCEMIGFIESFEMNGVKLAIGRTALQGTNQDTHYLDDAAKAKQPKHPTGWHHLTQYH